jgi:hypothetical protein
MTHSALMSEITPGELATWQAYYMAKRQLEAEQAKQAQQQR